MEMVISCHLARRYRKMAFTYLLLLFKLCDKYMETDGIYTKIQITTFKSRYFIVLIKTLMLIT